MRAILVASLLIATTGCRNDVDGDEDSIPDWADCNDADEAVGPGQVEVCNGIDDNCDGSVDNDASDATMFYADGDGDGSGYVGAAIAACDTPAGYATSTVSGSVGDVWSCTTNAQRDQDGDGYAQRAYGGADCNDNDASIHPAATDNFGDSIDFNCDFADGTDSDGDGYSSDDTNPDSSIPTTGTSTTCPLTARLSSSTSRTTSSTWTTGTSLSALAA